MEDEMNDRDDDMKAGVEVRPVLDHVGIAVRSLDAARIYEAIGMSIDHTETVESQGVRTAFLSAGDTSIELLEPLSADSAVGRFIEKRGEGIHHLCFRVSGIEKHLAHLQALGYRLINPEPVPGAHGCRVAFLHPAAANGVLIELSEKINAESFVTATGNDDWMGNGSRT
jgi:methylmalonyl-CoA epimerase